MKNLRLILLSSVLSHTEFANEGDAEFLVEADAVDEAGPDGWFRIAPFGDFPGPPETRRQR
jgi:hypothetical protein